MITSIALDDEPLALKAIEKLCRSVDFISLERTFTEPGEAMKYLEKYPVDLLFLDIKMPSVSGLNFYKAVKQNTMVIFTTAFSEFAVVSYELNAIDYLLKPISLNRFKQATEKASGYYTYIQSKTLGDPYTLYLRSNYSLVKICIDDILYIEGIGDYAKVFLKNKEMIISRISMKSMMEKLPGDRFIRVHRSFIVAFDNISSVRKKMICLDGIEIPLGNTYEAEFFGKYS